MSGYGGRERNEGLNDPLFMQTVAIDDGAGQRALLLGSDLLGFDYDFVDEVRAKLQAGHGLPPEGVLLNASHTHGGPAIINHLVVEAPHIDQRYRHHLVREIVKLAGEALANLAEADLYHGWGRCRIGINRRAPEPPYSMAPNPDGFYDDTVGVLAFCEPGTRTPRTVLFNAACHPTTLGSQPLWTADWPGAARAGVEAWLGEGGHAVFLQAACGNIRPRTFDPGAQRFRQGTPAEFTRMGLACAHEVIRILNDELQPVAGRLTCAKASCELPLEDQPTAADLAEMAAGDDKYTKAFATWAQTSWPEAIPTTLRYEAQLLTFGDQVSVLALPGEVVSELGHAARATVPRPTLFCGYSNGLPCYIPNAKIRRQGGYEAGLRSNEFFGVPGWLAQESELVILETIEGLVAGD
jgi:hypothetical protein